jgi:hypothetical protein
MVDSKHHPAGLKANTWRRWHARSIVASSLLPTVVLTVCAPVTTSLKSLFVYDRVRRDGWEARLAATKQSPDACDHQLSSKSELRLRWSNGTQRKPILCTRTWLTHLGRRSALGMYPRLCRPRPVQFQRISSKHRPAAHDKIRESVNIDHPLHARQIQSGLPDQSRSDQRGKYELAELFMSQIVVCRFLYASDPVPGTRIEAWAC